MKVKVLYFGMLAEALNLESEGLNIEVGDTLKDFISFIRNRHPQLEEFTFQSSINQSLATEETILSENDEIALLPPFAGG